MNIPCEFQLSARFFFSFFLISFLGSIFCVVGEVTFLKYYLLTYFFISEFGQTSKLGSTDDDVLVLEGEGSLPPGWINLLLRLSGVL